MEASVPWWLLIELAVLLVDSKRWLSSRGTRKLSSYSVFRVESTPWKGGPWRKEHVTMSTRNGRISIIVLFHGFHKSFKVCYSFAPLYRIRGITGLKRWFRIRTLISVPIEFLPPVCFKASWPSFLINYLMGRSVNHQTYQKLTQPWKLEINERFFFLKTKTGEQLSKGFSFRIKILE